MAFFPVSIRALFGFLVVISVFVAAQCQADEQVIQVVGIGECADCKERKIQTNHAFPGLHVTIDCKNKLGTIDRWGVGKLNEEGKFKISLPKEILKEGDLKHECYAQLHSASLAPCPAHNGLKSIKIVAKNDADGKHITFEPAQKLTFSTELCTSATFLPYHKPLPKSPKIDWKHHYKFPTPVPKTPEPPVTIPKTPEPPVTFPKTPEPPVTIPKTPEPPVTIPKKPEPPSKPNKPYPLDPKEKPKKEKPKKEEPKKKKPEEPKKEEPKKKKPEEPKKEEHKKKKPEEPKKEEPKKQMPPVVKPPTVTPPIVTPPIVTPPIVTPPIVTPPIDKPPIKKLPCPPLIPKLPPKDYHHPKLPPFPTIPPKYLHHPKLPHLPTILPKYLHHPKLPHLPPSPHIPHA